MIQRENTISCGRNFSLAIPARVVELLPGMRAIVDLSGVRKEVSIDLVDYAQVGDYVIIHVGCAVGRVAVIS